MYWDGVDQYPVIFEKATSVERDMYWVQKSRCRALRYGEWKIVSYSKKAPQNSHKWELYNLTQDPKEKTNVAAKNPEIVSDLHQRFSLHLSTDQ